MPAGFPVPRPSPLLDLVRDYFAFFVDDLVTKYEVKVAETPDNELFRFSLAKALIDVGRFSEAEPHLEVAFAKKPNWMVVVMLLGQCARQRQDLAAAHTHYTYALNLAVVQHHEDPEKEIREILASL
jgi:hypothetical protein